MSKLSKGIKELRRLSRRIRPGSVPGSLVDVTTGGTFVRPLSNRNRPNGGGPAKWM